MAKITTTTLTVQNIRFPNHPEKNSDDELEYKMIYVRNGVQHEVPCTKEIYARVLNEGLFRQPKNDFKLTISAGGVVEHITDLEKPVHMGNLNRVREPGSEGGPDMIVSKLPSGGFAVDHMPTNCTDETGTEIVNLLAEKSASLNPGEPLDENRRFHIVRVVKEASGEKIHVAIIPS